MNRLLAPDRTLVDGIQLGRRIAEIMNAKGKYYSLSAMSKRLGISRETYRLMLRGDRDIFTFELEKIATDLKVPLERITQEDIVYIAKELNQFVEEQNCSIPIKQLVRKRLELAIGETELCRANIQVGIVYFELRDYNLTHQYGIQAYQAAFQLQEKYGDSEVLYDALRILLATYTLKKDYENAKAIVENVKNVSFNNPRPTMFLSYTLGMIASDVHDFEKARQHFNNVLNLAKQIDFRKEIGKAEHNIADLEYKLGNYGSAKTMFERAISNLQGFEREELISKKDYALTLLRLNEIDEAYRLVKLTLEKSSISQFDILELKYRFLLAVCENEIPSFLADNAMKENHIEPLLWYIKTYVKDLLASNQYLKAADIIQECLPYLDGYAELVGKYYLLLAVAKNDMSYVEKVLEMRETDKYTL